LFKSEPVISVVGLVGQTVELKWIYSHIGFTAYWVDSACTNGESGRLAGGLICEDLPINESMKSRRIGAICFSLVFCGTFTAFVFCVVNEDRATSADPRPILAPMTIVFTIVIDLLLFYLAWCRPDMFYLRDMPDERRDREKRENLEEND
jgi:hypothetical protein